MFTKTFYKKFAKSLMELNSILRKELKRFFSERKLSIDEVTYLFTNDYNSFEAVLLKSYEHHFQCSVISLILIFVMFTLNAELKSEGCNLND